MFAVEQVDPRIGSFEVTTNTWELDGSYTTTEIEMVDCKKLIVDGEENDPKIGFIGQKAFNPYRATARLNLDFMCPNSTSFPSAGYFGAEGAFEYVSIRINRCQEKDLKN